MPLKLTPGQEFRKTDRELDRAAFGPLWLKDPRVATAVAEGLVRGDVKLRHYDLHAFVVMANHVHALISPRAEVKKITKALKGAAARVANRILNRTGDTFWQDESFDRWVRSEWEFTKIRTYIQQNPVVAGLVSRAEDWAWSSAAQEWIVRLDRQFNTDSN